MLPMERKNEILSKLMLDGKVVVSDLSELFHVTEETIRRDLDKLEKEGLAKKTYGGAVRNDSLNVELPYTVRKQTNVESKKYIAALISQMIEDGDCILLDASTTALYTVKNIFHKSNITLITNSVEMLLDIPPKNNWKVISTGGAIAPNSLSFTGHQAEKMVEAYHVDLAVLSCKGLDQQKGLTDTSEANADIKRAFLRSAKRVVLGADSSKFDKISFVRFADITEIDAIVTERAPSEEWRSYLSSHNVALYY